MNKKGQLMIWVIIAIVLVSSIIIYFYTERSISSLSKENTDPKPYIEKCARQAVEEAIDKMLPQGGFIEPKNYKKYDDVKREYLCRHTGYYKPCINQHPAYLDDLRIEIENYTRAKVEKCFTDLKNSMGKKKESMTFGPLSLSAEIMPSRVRLNIERNVIISAGDMSVNVKDFDAEVLSPLYDLASTAMAIVNEEVRNCYFEYTTYDLMHPKVSITKHVMSDSTKIYSIKDKDSFKTLTFALRGCGIPPGYG